MRMRVPLLSIVLLIPAASQAVQQSHSAAVPSQATRPRPTPLDLDATEAIGGLRVPMQNRYSREAWGLSEAAWARYRLLMQGIRGSTSQGNISPLEVLGIHAETEQERRDYARRYARMMKEDTDRVLAFARVYAEESAKLSAGLPILDKALLQLTATQPDWVKPAAGQ